MNAVCDFQNLRPAQAHLVAVRFNYPFHARESVAVSGAFNGWRPEWGQLKQVSDACWTLDIGLMPGRYEYQWVVDGVCVADPGAPVTVTHPAGGTRSVLIVEDPFPELSPDRWQDLRNRNPHSAPQFAALHTGSDPRPFMKKPHNRPRPAHAIQPKPAEPEAPKSAAERGSAASQSRDLREDHGTRQMKTASNPRTLPHGH
jgi:hypothetical protein